MPEAKSSFVQMFGVAQMPWIIRVYLLLFLIIILLMLLCGVRMNVFQIEQSFGEKIFPIAADSLKVVLGALIGSLSMAAQTQWGSDRTPAAGKRK